MIISLYNYYYSSVPVLLDHVVSAQDYFDLIELVLHVSFEQTFLYLSQVSALNAENARIDDCFTVIAAGWFFTVYSFE